MSRRVRKITPIVLKRMIVDEARKLRTEVLETGHSDPEKVAKAAPEVDADKLADTLENDIDYIKALKIKEARLKKRLREVKRAKLKLRRRITKRL
jgi:hypothetical protein